MNVGGALVYDISTDDVPVPLTDAPSPHQNAANFAPRVGLLYGFTPEI